MEIGFGLCWRLFSSRELDGTAGFGVVENSTLICSNQIFQEPLATWAEDERVTDGLVADPGTVDQFVRDPSC